MVQELPIRTNSCLSSLTSDQIAGNILVGGFGDGALSVFDRRLHPRNTEVRSYLGIHQSWIKNIHMQRGDNRELVSGACVSFGLLVFMNSLS